MNVPPPALVFSSKTNISDLSLPINTLLRAYAIHQEVIRF